MKERIKKLWAKKWLRWVGAIVVIIILGRLIFGGGADSTYDIEAVSRGSVTEIVTATGQIKPKEYASLRFKATGSIARLNVDVGDVVSAGQTLAVLDTSELSKKLTQAQADFVAARTALANAEQDVVDQKTKSEQALVVLYQEAPNTFNDILNLVQQEYASFATFYNASNALTEDIRRSITTTQLINDANTASSVASEGITAVQAALENFPGSASYAQIDQALIAIHKPLQGLQSALGALINTIASIPAGSLPAATLDAYKTTLAAARTNLNSAINKESTTVSNLRDTRVQNTLNENSKAANLRTAQANVEKSKAAVAIADQSLSDAYLRAPIGGTIAVRSKQIGELVTTADQVYYMLGSGPLEVISNVPEVDVARLRDGMEAEGTLDALNPDEKFMFVIDSIDPDQTTIDGVVYYKTHFLFKAPDPRFKSGMTVNLTLVADRRDDVLVVPRRAVTQRAGVSTIRLEPISAGATPEIREIKVGLKGDMNVEVLSGLTEGERIIVAEKKAL